MEWALGCSLSERLIYIFDDDVIPRDSQDSKIKTTLINSSGSFACGCQSLFNIDPNHSALNHSRLLRRVRLITDFVNLPEHKRWLTVHSKMLSRDEFNSAITVNGYPTPEDSSIYDYFNQFTSNYSREELAMLLAQLIHESGGFQYREEIACKVTKCPGQYVDNVGLPGRYYYGRGFIQLSWGANYKAASQGLGLGDYLLENPDEVANNTKYAVQVSTWYWEARVRPVLGGSNEFGLTTRAINGALECDRGWNERAHNRYVIYLKVADVLKIANKAVENGCYN